jgi:hypothetical protein
LPLAKLIKPFIRKRPLQMELPKMQDEEARASTLKLAALSKPGVRRWSHGG